MAELSLAEELSEEQRGTPDLERHIRATTASKRFRKYASAFRRSCPIPILHDRRPAPSVRGQVAWQMRIQTRNLIGDTT